jgi:hypothetical protein
MVDEDCKTAERPDSNSSEVNNMTNTRTKKTLRLDGKKWLAYVAASAAASVGGMRNAEADVTYVEVNSPFDAFVGAGTSVQGSYPLGLNSSAFFAFGHLQLGPSTGFAGFYVGTVLGSGTAAFAGLSTNGLQYVTNANYDQPVSALPFIANIGLFFGSMAYGAGNPNSQFVDPGIGFVGFRFDVGNGTQYGWAQVEMDGAP